MPVGDIVDRYHLKRAERHLDRGRLRSSSRHFARLSPDASVSSRAWRIRGRLLLLAGRPIAAVACFMRVVRSREATLDALLETASLLLHVRDFDQAEHFLKVYLRRSPADRLAATLLAHVYRAQGRFRTALDVLRVHRPKAVVGKYSNTPLPAPKRGWHDEKIWLDALESLDRSGDRWMHPARMAADRDQRDDLSDTLDDMARDPRLIRALAYGVGEAVRSDVSWLMDYVRRAAPFLRLAIPRELPMYIARHGNRSDRSLLLAGLAEGGETRVLSAAALISMGFEEFEEVLLEARERDASERVPVEAWSLADALLAESRIS